MIHTYLITNISRDAIVLCMLQIVEVSVSAILVANASNDVIHSIMKH
jgi:hypothetical protein